MKLKLIKHVSYAASISMMLAGSLVSSGASAAGFEVTVHSAEGLGRAYAGEGAVTDNASALSRNPAAAIVVPSKSLSLTATYVKPDIKLRGDAPGQPGALDADDPANEALVPAAYYVQHVELPYVGKVGVGLALKTDFGSKTRYHKDYGRAAQGALPGFDGTVAGKTELITRNMSLNLAYDLTPKLSAGVGLHVVTADASLNRYSNLPAAVGGPGTNVASFDGDDTDVTWSAGFIYKAAPGHQYSVAFRAKTDLELDGHATGSPTQQADGSHPGQFQAEAKIDLPEILEFSGTNQILEKTSVQYSASFTRWDRFDSLIGEDKTNGGIFFGDEDNQGRKNSARYAVGVTHELSPKLTVRAGFAFDEEAQQDDNRHLSNPDADRFWYTTGLTYQVTDTANIDVGAAWVHLRDETVDEPYPSSVATTSMGNAPLSTGRIEQEADGYLLGVQYNQKF